MNSSTPPQNAYYHDGWRILLVPLRFLSVMELVAYHSREVACSAMYAGNATEANTCVHLVFDRRQRASSTDKSSCWRNEPAVALWIASYFKREGTMVMLTLPYDTLW